MTTLILIAGMLVLLAGVIVLVHPDAIFGYLSQNRDKLGIYITAIVARLFFGTLLVVQSKQSLFPVAVEALGWFSIVAGICIAIIGHQNFIRMISWALSNFSPYRRAGGIIAAVMGCFLIYAFV